MPRSYDFINNSTFPQKSTKYRDIFPAITASYKHSLNAGYMTLKQRNYILGLFIRNASLHQAKHLKGLSEDPAALELSAFIGRRQIKTDETHSLSSYSHARGQKTWPKKVTPQKHPKFQC